MHRRREEEIEEMCVCPENGNSRIERQIIEAVLEESGGGVYGANEAVDRLQVPSNP
jgi:hypothetical protein